MRVERRELFIDALLGYGCWRPISSRSQWPASVTASLMSWVDRIRWSRS